MLTVSRPYLCDVRARRLSRWLCGRPCGTRGGSQDLVPEVPVFEPDLSASLAVGMWTSGLTSLSFCLVFCKMRRKTLAFRAVVRDVFGDV